MRKSPSWKLQSSIHMIRASMMVETAKTTVIHLFGMWNSTFIPITTNAKLCQWEMVISIDHLSLQRRFQMLSNMPNCKKRFLTNRRGTCSLSQTWISTRLWKTNSILCKSSTVNEGLDLRKLFGKEKRLKEWWGRGRTNYEMC